MSDFFSSPVHCYHSTSPSRAIVAVNTDTIIRPTSPLERPLPRTDGWWGPHEYVVLPQPFDDSSPYLAWIPSVEAYSNPSFQHDTDLNPTLIRLSFDQFPLFPVVDTPSPVSVNSRSAGTRIAGLPVKPHVSRPSKSHLHQIFRTSQELRTVVKALVAELVSHALITISAVKEDSKLKSIRIPEQAVFRLEQACLWNRIQNTEAGHSLVLAALKRAALELHGFLLWHRDQSLVSSGTRGSNAFTKHYRTRGVFVNNIRDYDVFNRFRVAVFVEVDLHHIRLPSQARRVDLSPLPIDRNVLFPEGYTGGHHCHLYFYPPIIDDPFFFELAARGYHSRSDLYRPNRDINKILENIRKDSLVAQNIYFPYVKGPSSHLLQRAREEYNKIQPFAPVPPLREWYSARQEMEYPAAITGQSRPPKIRSATPPPLFFFNAASPQKQQSYFYIWCCIRACLADRWTRTSIPKRDPLLLTHGRWREVLSGEIFRKNATPTTPFDLATFWRSDPDFIFKAGSVKQDLTLRLCDGTPLVPNMFDDSNPLGFALKRFICYDIAICHVQHQFEQTDDAFMAVRSTDQNAEQIAWRRRLRKFLFSDPVGLWKCPPPWEMTSLKVRAGWYERLRFFVRDWQFKRPGHLTQDISIMNEPAFSQELKTLLVVYFEGVAHFQNDVPTLLWTYPGTHGIENYLSL